MLARKLCQTEYIFYFILILYFNITVCPLARSRNKVYILIKIQHVIRKIA
jgi:hypothetical protein